MNVEGRRVFITGGGSGIGAEIGRTLGRAGAKVAIFDRDEEAAGKIAEEIKAAGAQETLAVGGDATDREQTEAAVARAKEAFGSIDILVNNVGIVRDRYLTKMSDEDWDAVIDTNLKSYFLASRATVPMMMEQKYGRIVNISSRAWLGNVGQPNYSAAKAGVVGMTRSMALELGKFNITVNCVAPGFIDTPLTRNLREDVWEKLVKAQPISTIGTPREVAYAVQFFAADEAFYLNGQVLYVCGGKSVSSFGSS